jgi:phenylalanyl-tRNA synthetase alpha chain
MIDSIENILIDFNNKFSSISSKDDLEQLKIHFLGKKSSLNNFFSQLKDLDPDKKKILGSKINSIRIEITNKIDNKKKYFDEIELNKKLILEKIDVTSPERTENNGFIHPISKTIFEIEEIFSNLGFEFATGPEIEDDYHNFTALNMPSDHPARQMQDTFYFKNSDLLLRTHTSNTQIRKMLNSKPPLRFCSLGRVFRRDFDQTHTPMFHQIEGFVVDKSINMGHLKWVLENFLEKFFETKDIQLRFRPSFFPFTEPSAEVDINYSVEQDRIKIGKGDKYMEILGCGMIHPNVLDNCKIDKTEFQGFAFGIGIERLTMLKYGINDLRMFFENDVRFLKHYGFKIKDF